MRPRRNFPLLERNIEMDTSDWEDFISKKKPHRDKEGKKVVPTTLLDAIDMVAKAARGSELDMEEIRKEAGEALDYLCSRMNLTSQEAIIMSMLIECLDQGNITLSNMRMWLDCTNVAILQCSQTFDELLHRGWITLGRNDFANRTLSYSIPLSTLEAIKKDEVPELVDETHLEFNQYFDRLGEAFNARLSGLKYETVVESINKLTQNNMHLTYCMQMQRLAKELEPSEVYLMHFFAHRAVNYNDLVINKEDLIGLFAMRHECMKHYQALSNDTHSLIVKGYVEQLCEDGMSSSSVFSITLKALGELLPESELPQPLSPQIIAANELVRCDGIVAKDLVYCREVGESVSRLADMLTAEKYKDICTRLQQYGYRHGLTCIFYGAPGTGKTETALQLARQSGRNIMQVSIADMRSKWVGESEKMVKSLFDRYRNAVRQALKDGSQVPILLFNEADALLTRRNAATQHAVDKMENAMQNIFLQEIETLEGILIATTNLTSNLDPAFERRFLYKVEFSLPDRQARCKIWKNMVSDLSDDEANALAARYNFSGGQIENISRKHIIDCILYGPSNELLPRLTSYCESELLNTKTHVSVGFQP